MNRYKITPSLFNAYYYQQKLDKPMQEFIDVLEKKEVQTNEAMQAGIDFENSVQRYCDGEIDYECEPSDYSKREIAYNDCVMQVAGIVQGGIWQEKLIKEIYLPEADINIFLKGFADVIKKDTIYDIKFVNKYEAGKYYHSIQHLIYLYCAGLEKFQYIISDGRSVWIESYHYNKNQIEELLIPRIFELLNFIQANGLLSIFNKHWIVDDEYENLDAGGNPINEFVV